MTMVTAFTVLGVSNMKDSSNATSVRVLDCQHLASSKLAPSLEVSTLTCPGAYAQSTLRPVASSRHEGWRQVGPGCTDKWGCGWDKIERRNLRPSAPRREFKMPVHVTPQTLYTRIWTPTIPTSHLY